MKLRHIGWTLWDPLGLLLPGERWQDDPGMDEYDTYLLKVAKRFKAGQDREGLVKYLVGIERHAMGGRDSEDAVSRAEAVVDAIADDVTIWGLEDRRKYWSPEK